MHEICHFPQSCTRLFQTYVDTWLKLKEEASGWPEGFDIPEQQQAHIDAYYAHESIRLDSTKIAKNTRQCAKGKMMLNSMWDVQEFTEPQPLLQFLASDQVDARYVSALTEDRVKARYKLAADIVLPSMTLNIFVAAFTTCHARLQLYQALHHLQDRVLYFDTDLPSSSLRSTLYPPHGHYLDDFKDELKVDEHFVEFCSGGPQNLMQSPWWKEPLNSITPSCVKTPSSNCTALSTVLERIGFTNPTALIKMPRYQTCL